MALSKVTELVDLSKVAEPQIVKSKDGKTATKYTVVKEDIDLDSLKKEKAKLEVEAEPSEEELLEEAKVYHPFYNGTNVARLAEIDKILQEYK